MKNKTQRSLIEEAIIKVYERYIKSKNDNKQKYSAYQFVQLLIGMTDEEFSREFDVDDEEGVKELVEFINQCRVYSLDKLRLKAAVAKHIEWSVICFEFSDDFKLENVGDEIVAKMLENVENRI